MGLGCSGTACVPGSAAADAAADVSWAVWPQESGARRAEKYRPGVQYESKSGVCVSGGCAL